MKNTQYFLDNIDGDWYVIPTTRKFDWFNETADETREEAPEYAVKINGDYTQVNFEKPKLANIYLFDTKEVYLYCVQVDYKDKKSYVFHFEYPINEIPHVLNMIEEMPLNFNAEHDTFDFWKVR
jgi:hypothetical protein